MNEDNIGVTKLSNYPEDNTGVEKDLDGLLDEKFKVEYQLGIINQKISECNRNLGRNERPITNRLKTENAALIAALKELIPIAEERGQTWWNIVANHWDYETEKEYQKDKSAIENAKLLIANKEPGN